MLLENVFVVIAFAAMTTFVSLHSVKAASFDCTGALTDTETAICGDAELRTFDRIMGILWGEEDAPSEEMLALQSEWLEERNLCGSDVDCLKQSYLDRLADKPFYLLSFDVAELYDLQTEEFGQYLFANTHYAYNVEAFVFALGDDERFVIPWIKPQFSEEIETCGLRVLSDIDWEFELSSSELGWFNVLNPDDQEYNLQTGEISVFTKWIGHGDLSSEVFYRLTGGQFVPDRALLDNCEDQQQEFVSVFFNSPLENLEVGPVHSDSPDLQLEGELVVDFDENAISPLVILQHWPICEFPSSLGQICKLFEDLERPVKWVDLLGWMGFDRRPIILNLMDTEITITAPEFWHFTYKIEPGPEGIWKVFFISDSIGGSLLTLTEYEVTIQSGEMSVRELSTVDWRYLLNTNSPIPRSDLLSEHMSRAQ